MLCLTISGEGLWLECACHCEILQLLPARHTGCRGEDSWCTDGTRAIPYFFDGIHRATPWTNLWSKYLLVDVKYLMGWLTMRAAESQISGVAIRFFQNVFRQFGSPAVIFTRTDRCLFSAEWIDPLTYAHTRAKQVASHSAYSYGCTEKIFQNTKKTIMKTTAGGWLWKKLGRSTRSDWKKLSIVKDDRRILSLFCDVWEEKLIST